MRKILTASLIFLGIVAIMIPTTLPATEPASGGYRTMLMYCDPDYNPRICVRTWHEDYDSCLVLVPDGPTPATIEGLIGFLSYDATYVYFIGTVLPNGILQADDNGDTYFQVELSVILAFLQE